MEPARPSDRRPPGPSAVCRLQIGARVPVSQWHDLINDATVADAVLDWLVHNGYRLELKGESLRKNKGETD